MNNNIRAQQSYVNAKLPAREGLTKDAGELHYGKCRRGFEPWSSLYAHTTVWTKSLSKWAVPLAGPQTLWEYNLK